MTRPLEELQDLLLDLISTQREVDALRVSSLDADDWAVVLSIVRQHRLGPLLHWRLAREKADVPVPEDVREPLAVSFKKATLRALVLQRELLMIGRTLGDAGIPWVALKGAYLAFTVYPHPALRPLRDLDVLVARERALSAYQALIDSGCRRPRDHYGDPVACIAATKHLPPLLSASGQVAVELHVRLTDPDCAQTACADEAGVWGRLIERPVAGDSIPYLSPTDLLLHLIVHALYDHRFNNGPLALADVSYLVRGAEIDWPLFWRRADEEGWTRGCLLVLMVAQRYFGELPVDLPASASPEPEGLEAVVATCASLMFTGLDSRREVRLAGALAGRPMRRKLSFLLRRVFPTRVQLAASHPVAPDSPRICLSYVSNCARILTQRVPAILASRKNAEVGQTIRQLTELDRWLVAR